MARKHQSNRKAKAFVGTGDLFAPRSIEPARKQRRGGRVAKPLTANDKLSEKDIHIAVAALLKRAAAPGVSWFHPANGELRDIRTAAKLKAFGVRPGTPDIILTIGGRTHGLELKARKGKLSDAQIAMHAEMRSAGAVVEVGTGIDEPVAILRRWGAVRLSS
jgi:hypothetical protein